MTQADKPKRQNRTLTVDFHDQATYFELLSNGKAFVEFVLVFILTARSMRTLFPGVLLGYCLCRALNKLPDKLVGLTASVRKGLHGKFHPLLHRCVSAKV